MIPGANPSPQPKLHLDRLSRFCPDDRRVFHIYFTMRRPLPPQNFPFSWGSGPPSGSLGLPPTRVLNLNSISVGSVVFAGLTTETDRPADRETDHATRSVTIGRIYVVLSM